MGGHLAIVGAGPGDPELLTLRAARLLAAAEIVFHDALVPAAILAMAADAELVDVGKRGGRPSAAQPAINAQMVRAVRAGRRVVRLKGGDPFLFGRGGEEVEYARASGITPECVPGVTAAAGCSAAAGIPLTHRDLSAAVVLVTGHRAGDAAGVDWASLAAGNRTIVVYMGLGRAAAVARGLIGAGLHPQTPAAIIENGTLPDQRVSTGALGALEAMAAGHGDGPALIVVGQVVRLSPQWREPAPPLAIAAE